MSLPSVMPITKYQWRPLDKARKEIRVLDLNPGNGDAPLSGQLRHLFLDKLDKPKYKKLDDAYKSDKPVYETISYAGGATALVDNISVDGKNIPIPASAGSALRCMRFPDKTRTLWIDCICIDQFDDLEKAHQVGLMAEIFEKSLLTLAHLGDDDGNTAEGAFNGFTKIFLASFATYAHVQKSHGTSVRYDDIEIPSWSSMRETIDWVGIKAIMMKPYFTRLGVVQEAVLSTHTMLCCGTRSIISQVFCTAASWLINGPSGFMGEMLKAKRLVAVTSFLSVVHAASRLKSDDLSFSGVLFESRLLQCSDSRDRVFGFLGLRRLSTKKCTLIMNLAPNYTKSITDVYCDTTRACIGDCKTPWQLDQLGYERWSDNTIEDLPTWVHNWYRGAEEILAGHSAPMLPREHHILWTEQPHATETPLLSTTQVGKILSIRGVVLEAISKHSDALIDINAHVITADRFVFSAAHLLTREIRPGTWSMDVEEIDRLDHVLGADRPDAKVIRRWWRYLSLEFPDEDCGIDGLQDSIPRLPGRFDSKITQGGGSDDRAPETQNVAGEARKSFDNAIQYCIGRKVFLTRSGLLGIGPTNSHDGDIIAVSKLSLWPMVLRRAEGSGPDHYSVIGHAFVGSIYNGEEIFAAAAESEGIGTIHLV